MDELVKLISQKKGKLPASTAGQVDSIGWHRPRVYPSFWSTETRQRWRKIPGFPVED